MVDYSFDSFLEIPETLRVPEFAAAWSRWQQHRKEIRKPIKPTQTDALLKKFAKWGPSKSVKAIETSIEHGWTGVFDPGENRNGETKPSASERHAERVEQTRRSREDTERLKREANGTGPATSDLFKTVE